MESALDPSVSSAYLAILRSELVPALGCTEPIAVAYAAALARRALGRFPDRAELRCSGNIIKNVKGVVVPNTGGLKGLNAAAVAGILGGDSDRGLQVLETVTDEHRAELKVLLDKNYCFVDFAAGEENLYIRASVFAGADSAEVVVSGSHTHVRSISKNGAVVFSDAPAAADAGLPPPAAEPDRTLLNIRSILEFARTVPLAAVDDVISAQIAANMAISDEGLRNHWGVDVGKTLLKHDGEGIKTRAKARAAAGSDARMSGCALPVVINSGSGNQGMAASLPVIEFAAEFKVPRETLIRALVLSNLTAIHQKTAIGKLSAYCGAVSAACGSGAAITFLSGGGYEEIAATITNTLANVGGIVCDGAKPSCAAKIASAVDAAIMAHYMSGDGKVFSCGEGLVTSDVELTIANFGRVGRVGMKGTDEEILRMMVGGSGKE